MQSWDKCRREGGLLIVLSGPSGVGKDSVLDELNKNYKNLSKCVTMTTRHPRDGEVDGIDYTFVTVDEFKECINRGGFLEYADVHGNFYGTPRKWVEEKLAQGVDIVLKIDVQGAMAVKSQMPSAVLIFVLPPSVQELERRLRGRLTETEDELKVRLHNAEIELSKVPYYNYAIVNDSLACAAEELKAVIIAEHCKIQQ